MTTSFATAMSDRGRALQRTFAAAFEAAKEHAKHHPHEVVQLYELIASHLRSAAPLSLAADVPVALASVPPAIDPETHLRRELADGAAYELKIDGALLMLQFFDVTGDNAMHHFDALGGKDFRDDLSRVLAAMGVR